MSVLIKGMEMPKSCYWCPLGINCDACEGYEYYCAALSERIGYENEEPRVPRDKRRDGCPLIEIPPHGRLIDEQWLKDAMITTLEALKKNPKMDKQEMHLVAAFDTLRAMIEDAPTIIERDE